MTHEAPESIRESLGYVRPPTPAAPKPQPQVMRLPLTAIDTGIPPEYHGAELSDAAREAISKKRVGLYVHGAPGTGKTRLAWAMLRNDRCRRMADALAGIEVTPPTDFDDLHKWRMGDGQTVWEGHLVRDMLKGDRVLIISESADIVRRRHDRDWLDEICLRPGWVVVDDIGFGEKPTAWAVEAIYHLANERRKHFRPTLWTSNLDPDGLSRTYGAAIASRLTGGKVLQAGGGDRRQGEMA
jgi:hypothetical protein